MWQEGLAAQTIIDRDDLKLIRDKDILSSYLDEVIKNNEKSVKDYSNGKEKALQSLIGQVMRITQGKADPEITMELLINKISK